MNLTRTTIVAGIAALSLGVGASPALAKPINNTVVSTAPGVTPAPSTNGGGGGGAAGARPPAGRSVWIPSPAAPS